MKLLITIIFITLSINPIRASLLQSYANGLSGNLISKGFSDTMNFVFAKNNNVAQPSIQPSIDQDYLNQYYQQQYFYNQGLLDVPPVYNPPQYLQSTPVQQAQNGKRLSDYFDPCDYLRSTASTGYSYGISSARIHAPQSVPITTGIFAQSAGGGAFNNVTSTGCQNLKNHLGK